MSVIKKQLSLSFVVSLLLTGCISVSHFRAWDGPTEFEGQGGAFTTKGGIDIYSAGTPKRKCRVLGIIDTSTMSSAEMMMVFGDSWSTSKLVKEAKARGGNAVILTDDRVKFLGWVSSGTATAYQSGNNVTAYGSTQTSANVSRERVAVLVKYVDINYQSAPQNSPSNLTTTTDEKDKRVETALIGHWAMVAHKGESHAWFDKVEMTFLPENRFASESIQNGKAYSQGGGRYSVKGGTMTIIDDQDSRPDAISFSLIENHLIINHNGDEVVFKRTDRSNFQLPAQQREADPKLLAAIRAKAEKGDAQSQYELGGVFSLGSMGVAKDEGEAVKWYRKAAKQNYAPAQNELGLYYAKGLGVVKDEVEAVNWFRKAAKQNYALSQVNLGGCYAIGRGVAQDYMEAVKWYRKAADQNLAEAQTRLGACYAKGLGVAKDEVEAVNWLRKAAEAGEVNALSALAWMLATSENSAIRDGAHAVAFGEKAVAATSRKDPAALDNLAAAFAEAGQFEKAVSTEQEAIALLRTETEKIDYETRLKLFEGKLPYRAKD